jgi:hypothetical protein
VLKRNDTEEEKIEQDKTPVKRFDVTEKRMVADPEDANHGEADRKTDHRRDVVLQLTPGVGHSPRRGHPQVHHQQRDRDREYRVAEEQHPVVFQVPGSGQRADNLAARSVAQRGSSVTG